MPNQRDGRQNVMSLAYIPHTKLIRSYKSTKTIICVTQSLFFGLGFILGDNQYSANNDRHITVFSVITPPQTVYLLCNH